MKQFGHPQLRLRYALLKSTSHESCFVDDVPNGLKCNCICPHCRKDLIAKNNPNNKRESHFAHTSGADCPGARMSSLHMLAQNILVETKQVMLPEYKGKYYHHDAEFKTFDRITKEEICRHEDSTRRPDCIGYNESTGASIWIEIYCRHKIDETKKAEIRKQQQYCIEIDFSDLLNTDFSEEDVRNRLLDVSHREWICCPAWDRKEEDGKKNALKEAKAAEIKRLQEIQAQQEEDERLQTIADMWYTHPDSVTTKAVIQELHKKPFSSKDEGESCIFDYLVPDYNWIGFIEKLPKDNEGRQVFYTLLRYYYNINLYNEGRSKLWRLDKPMWELLQKTNLTPSDSAKLEYMLVVWVLNELQNHKHFRDKDSQLGKIFVKNKSIREQVINQIKIGKARRYFDDENKRMQIEEDLKRVPDGDVIFHVLSICFPVLKKDITKGILIPATTLDSTTTSAPENPLETAEHWRIREYWEYVQKLPPSDKYVQQHSPKI